MVLYRVTSGRRLSTQTPVTHDGTPGQVLGLPPDLDALGSEHQVDVVAAVGPGVPAPWAAYPSASTAAALDLGTASTRTTSIMTTSRVSPKARRTRGLAVTLTIVRDPGSVARTIWLPFQVWVTGTRWMAPVGEAVAIHTLAPTAVSFDGHPPYAPRVTGSPCSQHGTVAAEAR